MHNFMTSKKRRKEGKKKEEERERIQSFGIGVVVPLTWGVEEIQVVVQVVEVVDFGGRIRLYGKLENIRAGEGGVRE